MKTIHLPLLLLTFLSAHIYADDGTVFDEVPQAGLHMTFKILSEEDKTLQIGIGDYSWKTCISNTTSGQVKIPSQIPYYEKPYTVVRVGYGAFYRCNKLTSIILPTTTEVIEACAIQFCTNLHEVVLGESLREIGSDAFLECNQLVSPTFPVTLERIGVGAFQCCYAITSITIPRNVNSIGEQAFHYCEKIENIVVDERNTTYDSRNNCNAIIETATNKLISGCKNTQIPDNVTAIGNYAFAGHTAMTEIKLPKDIEEIGAAAFRNCKSLSSIVAKMTEPPHISANNFYNISPRAILTIPYGTKEAYVAAGWTEDIFKGGIVEEEPTEISISISENEIRTFSSSYPLNFHQADNIKAYIASAFTPRTGEVILTRIKNAPANTGLILIGEVGHHVIPVENEEIVVSNLLRAVLEPTTLEQDNPLYTNFVFDNKGDGYGFYAVEESCILEAGTAYLPLEKDISSLISPGAKLNIVLNEDVETSISPIHNSESTVHYLDNGFYDLQGSKIADNPSFFNFLPPSPKGIYIRNGKKILVNWNR